MSGVPTSSSIDSRALMTSNLVTLDAAIFDLMVDAQRKARGEEEGVVDVGGVGDEGEKRARGLTRSKTLPSRRGVVEEKTEGSSMMPARRGSMTRATEPVSRRGSVSKPTDPLSRRNSVTMTTEPASRVGGTTQPLDPSSSTCTDPRFQINFETLDDYISPTKYGLNTTHETEDPPNDTRPSIDEESSVRKEAEEVVEHIDGERKVKTLPRQRTGMKEGGKPKAVVKEWLRRMFSRKTLETVKWSGKKGD
ncbi:hypothetical protein HDU67_002837 [Dinochytrium kinnereticum]|nr:hypothetical protein HDU67_002837 [Dinochytrium kinnereticum]